MWNTLQFSEYTKQKGRFNKRLTLFLVMLPIVIYVIYVYFDGVNMLFLDDWTGIVPLVRASYSGHLTLNLLWGQHNESRMFFVNFIFIFISLLTSLNVKILMYCSYFFLIGSCLLLYLLFQKNFKSLWLFVPVSWSLFSLVQWGIALWGFELAWYLVLFFTLLSFYFLDKLQREEGNRVFNFLTSLFAGAVASFSSMQGLIVWPVGLFFITTMIWVEENAHLKKVWRKRFYYWLSFGGIIFYTYFYGFHFSRMGNHANLYYVVDHIRSSLLFLLDNLGAIVPSVGLFGSAVIGSIILFLVVSAFLAFAFGLRREEQKRSAIYITLVLSGLAFDALILIGRSGYGLAKALTSSYSLYNLVLFIGIWLFFLFLYQSKSRRHIIPLKKTLVSITFIIFLVQVPASLVAGVKHGHVHKFFMNAAKKSLLLYNQGSSLVNLETERSLVPLVYPQDDHLFIEDIRFLKRRKQNVFARPVHSIVLIDYAKLLQQFPSYKKALVTLFGLYLRREDLQNAFPSQRRSFEKRLLKWAINSAKSTKKLMPYAIQYKRLMAQIRETAVCSNTGTFSGVKSKRLCISLTLKIIRVLQKASLDYSEVNKGSFNGLNASILKTRKLLSPLLEPSRAPYQNWARTYLFKGIVKAFWIGTARKAGLPGSYAIQLHAPHMKNSYALAICRRLTSDLKGLEYNGSNFTVTGQNSCTEIPNNSSELKYANLGFSFR